jgi:hypothetical protein
MTPARRTPVRQGRPDNDDTSATWSTEPLRRGRQRQRYCRGVRAVVGVGRQTWCFRGRRAAASGFKREVTINMLLGGACGKARAAGVEGAWRPPRPPSETTFLALAEALRRSSLQGWTFDVRRRRWRGRQCCRAGGYESRCWMAQLVGGGRATQSVIVATEDDDDGWDLPPPPGYGDGCGDAAVPSDRRLRRGRGTTRRDERGGGNDKGRERSVDDARRESGE